MIIITATIKINIIMIIDRSFAFGFPAAHPIVQCNVKRYGNSNSSGNSNSNGNGSSNSSRNTDSFQKCVFVFAA